MSQIVFSTITTAFTDPVTWLVVPIVVVVLFVVLLRPRCPQGLGARGEAAVARRLRRYCAEVANGLFPARRSGRTHADRPSRLDERRYSRCRDKGLRRTDLRADPRQNVDPVHRASEAQVREPAAAELRARESHRGARARGARSRSRCLTDRARFPKGLPQGVTTLSLLTQTLPLTTGESIGAAQRSAWETVMAHVLTDRLSRDAHLVIAQRRKRGW